MLCESDRVCVYIISKDLASECTKQEHFMLTDYCCETIKGDLLQAIESPSCSSVDLPAQNSLIPTKTAIKELQGEWCQHPIPLNVPNAWFQQDWMFR